MAILFSFYVFLLVKYTIVLVYQLSRSKSDSTPSITNNCTRSSSLDPGLEDRYSDMKKNTEDKACDPSFQYSNSALQYPS